MSSLGYVYSKTISCFASFRALGSSVALAPEEARESISVHLFALGLSGAEFHFLRRELLSDASGRRLRS